LSSDALLSAMATSRVRHVGRVPPRAARCLILERD
jgi:hypothetical protein